MNEIMIDFYHPNHISALSQFTLLPLQETFTAAPIQAIEMAKGDKQRYPMVILFNNTPVGFFVLHMGGGMSDYSTNPNGCLLRAFSINYKDQGKGYGRRGMDRLPQFIREHFPHVDEIVLAVNLRNVSAKAFYEKCGFIDKGLKKEGRIGLQYLLHYYLI